jgi:hypothetical protein
MQSNDQIVFSMYFCWKIVSYVQSTLSVRDCPPQAV